MRITHESCYVRESQVRVENKAENVHGVQRTMLDIARNEKEWKGAHGKSVGRYLSR